MNFFSVDTLPTSDLSDGVKIRLIPGEKMTAVFFNLQAGSRIPEHAHPHEQIGMVLKGSVLLTIGNEEKKVLPGIVYRVPSGIVHGGRCLEENSEVLEIFSPPREDLLQKFGKTSLP